LATDILVEAAVSIRADVESRNFLIPQVHGERVSILFPESGNDHCVQE
jgi:hypothetical protein